MEKLKIAKEDFVSNHSGSSLAEATLPAFVFPAVVLLLAALPFQWSPRISGRFRFIMENILLVGPVLAVFSEQLTAVVVILCCGLGIVVSLGCYAAHSTGQSYSKQKGSGIPCMRALADIASSRAMPCLSWYRAGLLIMTNLAILAVDFPVFPRRFAKVETYGTGLMDVGTGAFVFSQGLMRGVSLRPSKSVSSAPWHSVLSSSVPLLFIGGTRLIAVKSIEYQEHASEYGVHWNFFLTLAVVIILAKLLPVPEQWQWRGAAGLVITMLHQAGLQAGLGSVAMSAQRGPGLASLNKEGLISLPGYLALHCLGWGFGGALRNLFRTARGWGMSALTAVAVTGLAWLWAMMLLADGAVEAVSRRSCNAAYILWVAAQSATAISALATAEIIAKSRTPPIFQLQVADALSDNMLLSFLAANLLTGAVNMSVDTLSTSDPVAIAMLAAYMLTINALAWELMDRGLRFGAGSSSSSKMIA